VYNTAIVWQLMRAYTLSLLNKLKVLDQSAASTDQHIVSWVNNKVESTSFGKLRPIGSNVIR